MGRRVNSLLESKDGSLSLLCINNLVSDWESQSRGGESEKEERSNDRFEEHIEVIDTT
jgi:hypothetical protein